MKYKNPYYKKTKKAYELIISCGHCKEEVIIYEKVGKGGLLKMYLNRIIESNTELNTSIKVLSCHNCGIELGVLGKIKSENEYIYNMIRSSFNTRLR